MFLITVKDLSLGYNGQAIISGLNFAVEEGDYLCIVGENGSGKTTLMRTLLGLQAPLKGTILKSDELKKKGIGYLPQQTVIQKDFPASVEEIVLSGCLGNRSFYRERERKIAHTNMERMGITNLAKRSYRELSGGQQQRVLLARALCAADRALLLDEPVSGLDPVVTAEMYRLIYQLNREGVTIIMISHDVEAALQYATKILHIGKEVFFGSKQQYYENNTKTKLSDEKRGGEFE